MTERATQPQTELEQLREIRRQFHEQSGGDLSVHVQQTNQLVDPLIEKLGLKRAPTPRVDHRKTGS